MSDTVDSELVVELAQAMVRKAAPQEIRSFRAASMAYRADSRKYLRQQEEQAPLGWGAGEVLAMVTPAAFVVATTVAEYVITATVGPTVDRGVAATRRVMRRLFRLDSGEVTAGEMPIQLTPEQWQHIHSLVISTAVERGLTSATAHQMADAIVGKGVISNDAR